MNLVMISDPCALVFPSHLYDGTKSILISTRTVMGGKNSSLGIAYVVVGGVCIVLGALFLATHLIKPRFVGPLAETFHASDKELFSTDFARLGNSETTAISAGTLINLLRQLLAVVHRGRATLLEIALLSHDVLVPKGNARLKMKFESLETEFWALFHSGVRRRSHQSSSDRAMGFNTYDRNVLLRAPAQSDWHNLMFASDSPCRIRTWLALLTGLNKVALHPLRSATRFYLRQAQTLVQGHNIAPGATAITSALRLVCAWISTAAVLDFITSSRLGLLRGVFWVLVALFQTTSTEKQRSV